MFENAKWIWIGSTAKQNEYAVFEKDFDFCGKEAKVVLCAETDYVLYVNSQRVAFGQYAGFPFEKYYDEIDVTPYCKEGKNVFSVSVRYEGKDTSTHIDDGAGVIFELYCDGVPTLWSEKSFPCGIDERYIQNQTRDVTVQLGLTSGMTSKSYSLTLCAVEVEKTYNIKKRPVKKTEKCEFIPGIKLKNNERVFDLGRETAGYLHVTVKTDAPCSFKIGYGERLVDGAVPIIIRDRDFSLDFVCDRTGEFTFEQYFLRIAGRYLQAILPKGCEIVSIGVMPYLYPISEKPNPYSGFEKTVYDVSVRTLRLCMNTHYEDCPWREQALYVLDSRNQMLCGYYAFEESDFARANLILMSKGVREDGLLELTFPAVNTPSIPFFSLNYPVAVCEYIEHTGDKSILEETMPTMLGIMNNFKSRIAKNGLIAEFEPPYWNFYEWSDGNCGPIVRSSNKQTKYKNGAFVECDEESEDPNVYHVILNCALVYSMTKFIKLCKMANVSFDFDCDTLKSKITEKFFNKDTGLFATSTDLPFHYGQLANAYALLIGLGDERTANAIKSGTLQPATLSMTAFVYDALLGFDKEANVDFVLGDIEKNYSHMLNSGATSFWETIKGAEDFSGAGSLCHGWSAIPIYYYNILKKN